MLGDYNNLKNLQHFKLIIKPKKVVSKDKTIKIPIERILKAKESIRLAIFPSKSYIDYVLHYFPSTNKKKLYAVWNFRSFDEATVQILENTVLRINNKKYKHGKTH